MAMQLGISSTLHARVLCISRSPSDGGISFMLGPSGIRLDPKTVRLLKCSSRYYANSALDSIHRGMAVEIWSKCYETGTDPYSGLDRALGAFDLFVLHDQPQDLEYVC